MWMAGSSPAMTKAKQRRGGRATHRTFVHKNVWGLAGLPLEFPRLPSHIGDGSSTKSAVGGGNGSVFSASRWEIGNFRAFSVREETGFRRAGAVKAPRRVVLRSEKFDGSIQDFKS